MWPYPQEIADLVTFAEEIFNGKLYFLWSAWAVRCFFCFKHYTSSNYKYKNQHTNTFMLHYGTSKYFMKNSKGFHQIFWGTIKVHDKNLGVYFNKA